MTKHGEPKGWFVNAPGSQSPAYASVWAALRAAGRVRGSRVSRRQTQGGRHTTSRGRVGATGLTLTAVAAYLVIQATRALRRRRAAE